MTRMRSIIGLVRLLARFRRDARGVSAVEFAMVLPLMVILFVGVVQVSELASLKRKTTLVARAVADLVAQVSSIDQNEMNNVMAAGTAVIAPFPTGKLKIRISSVKIDANKNATIAWSKVNAASSDWAVNATNAPVTLDDALKIANSYLMMAEVSYEHQPPLGYGITGALSLTPDKVSDKIFMRPRLSDQVTWVN